MTGRTIEGPDSTPLHITDDGRTWAGLGPQRVLGVTHYHSQVSDACPRRKLTPIEQVLADGGPALEALMKLKAGLEESESEPSSVEAPGESDS